MKVASLCWKMNRLRAMGLSEILWRTRKYVLGNLQKAGFGLALQYVQPKGVEGKPWLPQWPTTLNVQSYQNAAERILEGRFTIFSLRDAHLGFPPQWNRDPLTQTDAPMVFGKSLNYRNENLVGNIKYLWEPNRHLELTVLAQAYALTSEDRYADGVKCLLESWFTQCPYPLGPNWISSLEHAVRLVNWSFTWHLLGGENGTFLAREDCKRFKLRWLQSVYQHIHFISGHLSHYSSANNHLLGEYMGLFIGTATWPLWDECTTWTDIAHNGLEVEALKQNTPDGVNREQAIWYHHEVADMMLLCGELGRSNGIDFSSNYWNQLEKMLEYIAAMMDTAGNVPMIGDSDDAVMIRFAPDHGFDIYPSLLATGAVLFDRPDFAAKARIFDDKSRWLLGDEGACRFAELMRLAATQPVTFRREFPDGGYSILGKDFETEREVKLIADAGPLGYLSIAAHGHADALALVLFLGGKQFLIDPGTYAYHTERKWRDYFKGTSAHNTLRIDRVDQSVSGGNFLWLKHAQAYREEFTHGKEFDVFEGRHDGYERLKDPVTHWRKITCHKPEDRITVHDRLLCQQHHFVELFWHFSEPCTVTIEERAVIAVNGDVRLEMTMPETTWQPRLYFGDENLPLGWISRSFDRKEPSPTVVWAGEIHGPTEFSTQFRYFFYTVSEQ